MFGYIYLTENIANGKCYIGKHKSNYFDNDYKGSGIAIKRAIDKYGKENFITTIIAKCESEKELNEKEKYWIKKCDAVNSATFYNLCDGGQGGNLHQFVNHKKLSEALKGKKKSDTHKAHMKLNHADFRRGNHPEAKKVVCVETGMIFDCLLDAAEWCGLKTRAHIGSCCNNKRKSAGGYNWRWLEEDDRRVEEEN